MPDPSPAAMEAVKTLQSGDHDLPISVACWVGEDAVDAARIIDAAFAQQMREERHAARMLRLAAERALALDQPVGLKDQLRSAIASYQEISLRGMKTTR